MSNEDKALQLPSLEELLGRRDLGIVNTVQALGCGTYGIVLLVRRLGFKDDFACKVLNSQMAEDSIRSEVEIMRRLNGVASVMQLLGTCQEGNRSYLLLPLGRVDMASRVDQSSGHWPLGIPGLGRRRPGLSMKELKFYAAYILTSLRDIHERGVIHRDIKPENIMIGDDGYVSSIQCPDGTPTAPFLHWSLPGPCLNHRSSVCGSFNASPRPRHAASAAPDDRQQLTRCLLPWLLD